MNEKIGNISFKYISGLIPQKTLEGLESDLQSVNIDFETTDANGVAVACYDEIMATLSIFLSDELVRAYILGLVTNSTYEILRNSIICIWKNVEGKKINVVRSDSITEKEATFDMNIRVKENQLSFKLKGDCSDEIKQRFIDKAFECVANHQAHNSKHLLYFPDIEKEEWEMIPQSDYIRQNINKK
ncbi:hypothetical protein P4E94_19235 [Pontiellaceae bacterium B12219]|nr:hypothetical protein [Pontiellaceae bacterium B12219]